MGIELLQQLLDEPGRIEFAATKTKSPCADRFNCQDRHSKDRATI